MGGHLSHDAVLTAAIRECGDAEATAELCRRHAPAVLAYARGCCRDPHTAEDLASEAFTRTVRAVRDGKGPVDAWRPYLLSVVRHTAADWADHSRRVETFLTNAPTFADEQADPEWAGLDLGRLSGCTGPALLTKGTESPPWFATITARLSGALSQMRTHTFQGAGHIPHARAFRAPPPRFDIPGGGRRQVPPL